MVLLLYGQLKGGGTVPQESLSAGMLWKVGRECVHWVGGALGGSHGMAGGPVFIAASNADQMHKDHKGFNSFI
jgi:hypothetical protein